MFHKILAKLSLPLVDQHGYLQTSHCEKKWFFIIVLDLDHMFYPKSWDRVNLTLVPESVIETEKKQV